MTLTSSSSVWKWGLLSVLFMSAIAAVLFWERSWMSQYKGMASEGTAGLAAVYPSRMVKPAMVAAETQAAAQASDGLMIIRTASLNLAASRLDGVRSRIDDVVRRS